MFLFINYCSEMFRSQFLAIFREFVFFVYSLYVNILLTTSMKISNIRGRNMSEQ